MVLLNNNLNISLIGLYPEIFLLTSVLLVICVLVTLDYKFNYEFNLIKHSCLFFVYSLLLTIYLNFTFNFEMSYLIFYNSLVLNQLILNFKNFICLLFIIISLLAFQYFRSENIYTYEFFILLNLVTIGLFTIISANDLLVMYMGIEILSLSFYILTTMKIHSNFSTEAGMKYFILGAFSSGLLLYGSSLIYGSTGTINFSEINLLFQDSLNNNNIFEFDPLILGVIFVTVGILFKLGAAPFHMWLPDVYEGSPTIVTLIFSIVPKIILFGLLFNFYFNLYYINNLFYNNLIFYVALLSIIIGSLGALYQIKIKRLLAYSAINHVGYLLIGFLSFQNSGIFSLFFYLFVYILMSLNLFIVLLIIRKQNNNLKLKKINEYVMLFKSYPLIAINFALILFSVAGIPPLVGFYSKLYIFISALKSDLYFLVLIAAIFSVISCLYYIRVIKLMFFKNFEYWTLFKNVNFFETLSLSVIFLFNILFFCYPDIIVLYISNIVIKIF